MNINLPRQLALLVVLACVACVSVAAESVSLQAGTDRMGGDYKSIALQQADPQACRQACADDATCKSFSFVKPGIKGPAAMCFLKSSIGPVTADNCCSSGAKTMTMASMPGTDTNMLATKPALTLGTVPTTAAAPLELLKQVNALKATVAAQEQTIASLKQAVNGMFESIDKLNTSQAATKNQFINFKTSEYAPAMEKMTALDEKFNGHKHFHKVAVDNGDGQKIFEMATTSPTFNCKKMSDGKHNCSP